MMSMICACFLSYYYLSLIVDTCIHFFFYFAFLLTDIESYAKKTLLTFAGIPQESGLWENISHCSDVLEGAWYLLYDDKKKPKRSETVKKFIRESIDSFHSTLVTESKICISLAVFGPLGAGKSFFLNSLLNWGLDDDKRVENGPLPSASGGSQTPLPIYVKYRKSSVQVLLHKHKKGEKADIWLPEAELSKNTLACVNNLLMMKFQELKMKFQEDGSLGDVRCIELQGPFPIFDYLKKKTRAMTQSGHLELEVDVEFVDVPGCGDHIGNECIKDELNKADVVLFFDWGKSGRPVSPEDIAQVFRRHDEFEFTSRPKLVHIASDRGESSSPSSSIDEKKIYEEKEKDLKEAWSRFLFSSSEDEATSGCYKEVRQKLPRLNGEDLLEKFSSESEVICFHSENSGFAESLKNVINNHVQSVKIKQTVHPFLQNIHLAAKKLKTRIGNSISTAKRKSKAADVKEGQAIFRIFSNKNDASDLVLTFLDETNLPLQVDIKSVHRFLYDEFLYSSKTLAFLIDTLKQSLETFTNGLIYAITNANWSTLQDVPSDLIEVIEILCDSRVQQFCANSAPAYLLHVLDKGKNRNPLGRGEKKRWLNATPEEKKDLCGTFLHILLNRTEQALEKETRDKQHKKSHFQLNKQLKEDVKGLFAVRSLDEDASRTDLLKVLHKKLDDVIDFCNKSIREINPHPCLDVQADISLPDKMVNAHEDNTIPSQSNHDKIIQEMTELLRKTNTKGADAIRKLETKLNFNKGDLELRQSQSVDDQLLWAKALINVLSDEDHFNIALDSSLVLDHHNEEIEKLLNLARKRLFAHQKSYVTCKMVDDPSLPDNQIHFKKSTREEKCLEVLVSSKMSENLDTIREKFKDPSQQLAPIFIPTIRPGPTLDITGNYFLEEDPWSKDPLLDNRAEEEGEKVGGDMKEKSGQSGRLDLNIFLVVEPQHLEIIQTTVDGLQYPTTSNINLMYVVLPQKGRGIGVTRAIIKSLAECFKFSLYWTIDDDIQFMYQFDENDRRWHKCSLTRGLLFGQRVFQTCLESTVKELSEDERHDLLDELTDDWPNFTRKTQRRARSLLIDRQSFAEVQKNPALLHSPFANISEDCGGDAAKEEALKDCERKFVDECRKRLFQDAVNHIAGVSIAHESSKRYDYMSKYPRADYMSSEQRYQVVLNNVCALKGKNFVTDEMIFHDQDFQVYDKEKRNTPYWGVRSSDKSFCRAMKVSGVIGYQVIRIVHSHKKLRNVFDRVGPSYITSQSPYKSEDEDEDDDEEVDVNVNS